jgi:hypothetical protein
MTYHALFHGGVPTRNPGFEQYPSVALPAGTKLMPAAHKHPAMFSITRLFDFSQKDMRRQPALSLYLERHPIAQGDVIGASVVPGDSFLVGFAWGVDNPTAGVVMTAAMQATTTTPSPLATINAGLPGSGGVMLAAPVWLKESDVLNLTLAQWPSALPVDLRFWVSPIVISPRMGN